jgi:tetratricopeptide (TPR) repeat protein
VSLSEASARQEFLAAPLFYGDRAVSKAMQLLRTACGSNNNGNRSSNVTGDLQRQIAVAITMTIAAVTCQAQALQTPDQQRQAAFALEQQGQYSEAEDIWRAVLTKHPNGDAEAYAHLGFLEARQEHYKGAVAFYRKAAALNPSMPELQLNLGLALFKSGELRQAIQVFTPLFKKSAPSSPEALRFATLIGMAYYGLGEYAAAVPYLRTATTHDPQYLLPLAQSCLSSQQYQCVLNVYHQILELNAESAEADMLAGEAMDGLRNKDGAIQAFREAVKANPQEPYVHFGLGYLLWTQHQLPEAASEFEAELANVPEQPYAMTFLADCYLQMNNPEKALPLLEKALSIDPKIARAHLDLGTLYADMGKQDEALRELKAARNLTPDDADVHWKLARLYQTMGRRDEAKIEFDKTKNLKQTANNSIFEQLHAAQARGKKTNHPTHFSSDQ